MTATYSRGRGQQPGVHGRAVARRGSATTRAPERARHLGRAVASSRCRRRSPRSSGGTCGSRPRSAGASSRQGSTRSQTGSMSSTLGIARPASRPVEPLRSRDVRSAGGSPGPCGYAREHGRDAVTPRTQRPVARRRAWAGLGVAVAAGRGGVRGAAADRLGGRTPATARPRRRSLPPLHGYWDPRFGVGTPARRSLLAVARRWRYAVDAGRPAAVARACCSSSYAVGAGLAARARVRRRPERASRGCSAHGYEYLGTAREVDDVRALLDGLRRPDPARRARTTGRPTSPGTRRRRSLFFVGAGPGRARRRPRRRAGRDRAGRGHAPVAVLVDAARARRRGRWPGGRRRSWC